MDNRHGYDAYGWPRYDASWFWTHAVRPAIVVIAAILALVAAAALSLR